MRSREHYLNSQSGAALILVLFLIVFLASMGSVMLFSTTYSQKTIALNSSTQGEFYRSEGAIALKLDELRSNELNGEELDSNGVMFKKLEEIIISKGGTDSSLFEIGDRVVVVTIEANETTDPSECKVEQVSCIRATITANYQNESNVKRVLNIVTKEIADGTFELRFEPGNAFNYVNTSNSLNTYQVRIGSDKIKKIDQVIYTNANIYFTQVLTNKGNLSASNTEMTVAQGHYGTINAHSGGRAHMIIPEGTIVNASKLSIGGGKLTVKGALILGELEISGTPEITVDSGIIVSDINIGGNIGSGSGQHFVIGGKANGIDCGLLPSLSSDLCEGTVVEAPSGEEKLTHTIDYLGYGTKR